MPLWHGSVVVWENPEVTKPATNIYLELTREFNKGRLRAIVSSGQAVVLHRLAVMSKDGDWILREDKEALAHTLDVLSDHDARYRFGAPLDIRWMSGGWSSHLQFSHGPLRVRTDFVTRPPRISPTRLLAMWKGQEARELPVVNVVDLVDIKKTNRERDYAIIGELARTLDDPRDQLLYSRSARDLLDVGRRHPDMVAALARRRPVLRATASGLDALEAALDAERRKLIHANERRLQAYREAAQEWASLWNETQKKMMKHPLGQAHEIMVNRALGVLPFRVEGEWNRDGDKR